MSVHGSELKCKYLIKVNPGQVNKPAAAGDRGTRGTKMGKDGERGEEGGGGGEEGRTRGLRTWLKRKDCGGIGRVAAKRERTGVKSAREPSVLRGGFYCRFLLAE